MSQVINGALEEHFPERSVRVIAEPGRYFAAAAYTLAACIHAKRDVSAHYLLSFTYKYYVLLYII